MPENPKSNSGLTTSDRVALLVAYLYCLAQKDGRAGTTEINDRFKSELENDKDLRTRFDSHLSSSGYQSAAKLLENFRNDLEDRRLIKRVDKEWMLIPNSRTKVDLGRLFENTRPNEEESKRERPEGPPEIKSDPSTLYSFLWNILIAAVKYPLRAGVVVVCAIGVMAILYMTVDYFGYDPIQSVFNKRLVPKGTARLPNTIDHMIAVVTPSGNKQDCASGKCVLQHVSCCIDGRFFLFGLETNHHRCGSHRITG
jgi:hypothetical protein